MKICIIFTGTTGAGPVYSLEMASAIMKACDKCEMLIVINRNIKNLDAWKERFENKRNIHLLVLDAYKHTWKSVLRSNLNLHKLKSLVKIIKEFNADVCYIPFGLIWGWYICKKLHGICQIIATIHDVHPHDISRNIGNVLLKLGNNYMYRHVNDIIILNKTDYEYVKNSYKKPVYVIPHASFSYYKTDNFKSNGEIKYKIGFFGRIEPYKGLDILIEAFEQITNPKLTLIIAGSGNISSELLDRIRRNSKITLINRYIEDFEVKDIFNSIDIVVLPYKRASQSGVIPTAFSFGKMVITTNVGALYEQITTNTGILTNPDPFEIAKIIDKLYSNEEIIKIMGKNALEFANKNLSWSISAELLLKIINKRETI